MSFASALSLVEDDQLTLMSDSEVSACHVPAVLLTICVHGSSASSCPSVHGYDSRLPGSQAG